MALDKQEVSHPCLKGVEEWEVKSGLTTLCRGILTVDPLYFNIFISRRLVGLMAMTDLMVAPKSLLLGVHKFE